jgi:hypothetical protein
MNLKVSGFGAEPKKLAVLGGCVLVATYFYFSNRTPSDSASSASVSSSRAVPAAEAPVPLLRKLAKTRHGAQSNTSLEFHPTLRFKEGDIDRAKIDPTLRLDLLDKVQNAKIDSINRSLFDVLTAPPVDMAKIPEPGPIIPIFERFGPPPPSKPQVIAKAPEPPAPPIPLKFYGFINPVRSATDKRAFFLDGDDIIVANEGQLVKSRYKIVRIGVNSADVEDTQFKNNKQTLPLVKEEQSS